MERIWIEPRIPGDPRYSPSSVGILHPNMLTPVPRDYHAIQLVNTPEPVNQEPAPVRPIKAPTVAELKAPSESLKLPQVHPRAPIDDPPTVPTSRNSRKIAD